MQITLLAATTFDGTRCCIAGINSEGRWIRPGFDGQRIGTLGGSRLVPSTYLWPPSGFIGGSLAVIEAEVEERIRKDPPHLEDAEITSEPRLVASIRDEKNRLHFLEDHAENGVLPPASDKTELASGLSGLRRSLILVGPVRLQSASFGILPGYKGMQKYRTALTFKLPRQKTEVELPCVDIRWRALGRVLGAEEDPIEIHGEELCKRLSVRHDIFVALGLTRGTPYAMVVGVHSLPDYAGLETEGGSRPIRAHQNNL
jgi:hypothetical protein